MDFIHRGELLFLSRGEIGRDLDENAAELIATDRRAAFPTARNNALVPNTEPLSAGNSRRNADVDLAIEGGDRNRRAAGGFGGGDGKVEQNVVPFAFKVGVRFDVDEG